MDPDLLAARLDVDDLLASDSDEDGLYSEDALSDMDESATCGDDDASDAAFVGVDEYRWKIDHSKGEYKWKGEWSSIGRRV
jgi:hypothetical protein